MTESVEPPTYTGRRDLIAEKLEPYLQISDMLPSTMRPTSESVEKFWDNSLLCSWADRATGRTRSLTVSVYQAADGEQRAHEIREMMRQECPPGLDLHAPNPEAYEIAGPRPGEYVFILSYLGHVRAVVGNCVVHIMPMGTGIELSELTDPALDIGRTVGCSPYENDFTLPEFPEEWRNQSVGWRVEGGSL
ncbi:hypothetical protein A5782_08245 [Mycobacterium sp. 852002-40037_SCH5390672]|nr:hypothetical protein [Mycobacterium sp. 852002-40037_SCH5390672]OBB95175.1 hypothetical protein A5782_08245 [Mycobacterium sp. 852002-40037_SCH5390672]